MKWLPLLALLMACPVFAQSFKGVDQRPNKTVYGVLGKLSGITRGGNPPSAAELSGDATTNGSNAVSVVKVNGGAVPASANPVSTNGSSQFVAATVQGNGTKVQLSTGATTTNDCVKYDASGNTVDNGSSCAASAFNTASASTIAMVNYGGL